MLTYHHSFHRGVKTETPVVQRVTPWRLSVSEKRGRRRRRRGRRGENRAPLSLSPLSLASLLALGFRNLLGDLGKMLSFLLILLLWSPFTCSHFGFGFCFVAFFPPLLLFAKFSSIGELSALYSSSFLFRVRVPPPSGGSECLSDATIPAKFCFYRVGGFPFFFFGFIYVVLQALQWVQQAA
jgi:hypothetical protein